MKFSTLTTALFTLFIARTNVSGFTTTTTTATTIASRPQSSASSSRAVVLGSTAAKKQPAEVIDEAQYYEKSTFPISPDDLIQRSKEILGPDIAVGTKDGGECLADNFEFCAAVVGPLPKDQYLGALGSFKLEDSFDITMNAFGFTVDPLQTNRVWFFQRQTATQINDFAGIKSTTPGKELILPPQVFHFDFNREGKVTEFGFYTVDRRQGNTGGLGGAFGYFYGVGRKLGFPEAMPYKPSFRFRMLSKIGALARKLQQKSEETK